MGCEKRYVEEKWLGLVTVTNPSRGLVPHEEGLVAFVIDTHAVALEISSSLRGKGREVADLGMKVSVEVVEPTFVGVIGLLGMPQMPFAHHRGLVSRGLEALGHEVLVGVNAIVAPRHDHGVGDAQAHRISSGHQGRTGG